MQNFLIRFFLCISFNVLQAQHLVINEICSKNQSVIADFEGDYPDWLELYNGTDTTINLLGYQLSDNDDSNPFWSIPIPILLAPDDYLLIFASEKDDFISAEFHTDFAISSSGETISLLAPDSTVLDLVLSPNLEGDQSYGRTIDGEDDWSFFTIPTPGISNLEIIQFYEVDFSHAAGFYQDSILLELTAEAGLEIRYTTDGRLPSATDSLYVAPLLLKDRAKDPNYFCLFESTPTLYEPVDTVDKFNIIRVAAFLGEERVTSYYTKTYAIGTRPLIAEFPVLSIIVEPEDFFGADLGIWVNGSSFDEGGIANYDNTGANWERPMHIEFFDENKQLDSEQNAGIRIHGSGGRWIRHKSMRIYARNEYGKKYFTHSLIGEEEDDYKRLVLRNIKSSGNKTFFSDEFGSELMWRADAPSQNYRVVVLYVNGEYWGLYAMKTRIDRFHLEETFGIDKNNVDLFFVHPWNNNEGDDEAFLELKAFLDTTDLSIQENYDFLCTKVDVENFMNYLVAELYQGNTDWPGNNHYYFREKNDTAKWRWVGLDFDFSFMNVNSNRVYLYFNSIGDFNTPNATLLGRRLIENDGFKALFISRFEECLNTVYRPDELAPRVLRLYDLYKPQFNPYLNRFDYAADLGTSLDIWQNKVTTLLSFVSFRPCAIRDHIFEEFGVSIDVPDCQMVEIDTTTTITSVPHLDAVPYYSYEITDRVLNGINNKTVYKPLWWVSGETLLLKNEVSQLCTLDNIQLFDLSGKLVFEERLNSAIEKNVSLHKYSNGIYFIKTTCENVAFVQKIVLNR